MSDPIKSYRDLIVWQKAMDLGEAVYRLAAKLPKDERFALSDQLRRAAVSVPANIAEGHARQSKKEYAHFLSISQGSVAELETQLLLSSRLGMIASTDIDPELSLAQEVSKMLTSLQNKLAPTQGIRN